MKHRPISKKKAVLISTLLVAVAIPATVLGTQRIQDIRNQAAEENTPIDFTTDFNSENITNAYVGIPYEKTVGLTGYNAKNSSMYLGCDPEKCGTLCNLELHNPPYGLKVGLDSRTLIWEKPQESNDRDSWDITLTAVAPDLDSEEDSEWDCAIGRFTLDLSEKTKNVAPTCSIEASQYNLTTIPKSHAQSFILEGKDIDGGISSAKVTITSKDGEKETKTWNFSDDSEILINKDSTQPLIFDLDEIGSYSIEASVTDSDGEESDCDQRRDIEMVVTVPGDQGSPEFLTDPYKDASPSASIDIGQSYRYEAQATDPNDDEMDYYIINDTGWLKFSVTENEPGSFKGLFSGTPNVKGAYTVVLSLKDGYHDHYSTQIWVVDVGKYGSVDDIVKPDEDDVPDMDSFPQILNTKPLEKAETTDTLPLISASLKAADNSKIVEDSVIIELDDTNVTEEAQIRGENRSTGSVTFIPDQPLHKGTHRITVSFEDTSEKKAEKSWTFSIKSDEDAIPVPEEEGIEILGYIISRRMAIVLLIGIGLIALAIAVPWIMYNMWRRTKDDEMQQDPSGYMLSKDAVMPQTPKDIPPSPKEPQIPSNEPGTFEGFDTAPTEENPPLAENASVYEKPPEPQVTTPKQVPEVPQVEPVTTEQPKEEKAPAPKFTDEVETEEVPTPPKGPQDLRPSEEVQVGK